MDLLKKENGATMIETLVGIILLGIIITISFSLFIRIYSNPNLVHKHEAFLLASQEISNCINIKTISDTVYTNKNNNLTVTRKIQTEGNLYTAIVKVTPVKSELEIIVLSACYIPDSLNIVGIENETY